MSIRRLIILLTSLSLVAGACGGDDSTETSGDDDSAGAAAADDTAPSDDEAPTVDTEELVEDLTENLEDLQESQGGGSATLVVGDMTYTFDSVVCAFGEEETGQAGAEFNLSSIQDGTQMYASIDSFGHSVSLDDIVDFDDPSVSLRSVGEGGAEFIVVDGKSITAESDFLDNTADEVVTTPGTFTATCP